MTRGNDSFTLDPAVSDAFSTITDLQQCYDTSAPRDTTCAFMRLKLDASLSERALSPHVFETLPEAQALSAGRTGPAAARRSAGAGSSAT